MKREQHINLKPDKTRSSDADHSHDDKHKMPVLAIILIALIVVCMAVVLLSALSAYW